MGENDVESSEQGGAETRTCRHHRGGDEEGCCGGAILGEDVESDD